MDKRRILKLPADSGYYHEGKPVVSHASHKIALDKAQARRKRVQLRRLKSHADIIYSPSTSVPAASEDAEDQEPRDRVSRG